MFRAVRQEKCRLDNDTAVSMLQRGQYGVLAVTGDNAFAYAVPLNYAYEDGKIYFHGAREGHKVDALAAAPKVSFCVVDRAVTKPEQFTCSFESVIAFGVARELEGDEKQAAVDLIVRKYSSDYAEKGKKIIQAMWDKFATFEIAVEHLTGKKSSM